MGISQTICCRLMPYMDNLNLFHELEALLRADSRYCMDDGILIKNKIVSDALSLNPALLKYLLSNESLKNNFFSELDGMLIFDKVKFQQFVMNKSFLPDSYTAYKNKIGLTTEDGRFISESREVVLAWPYKDCMLEGGQTKEDAKRNEIFWSETLAPDDINRLTEPKAFTGFKRYDREGEHDVEHLQPTDNLIIKGNNLLALYSLRKKYAGRIKMIYIDPPYNTGNDSFGYNDTFKHSTWLTFMKNRLEIATELLAPNGIIFVQCDDNENAYLKVLMDGIKELRFINNIAVKMSEASGVKMNHAKDRFPKLKEYILVYTRSQFDGFIEIDKYKNDEWDRENNLFLEGMTQTTRNTLIDYELKDNITEKELSSINTLLSDIKIKPLASVLSTIEFSDEDEKRTWLFDHSYQIIKTAGSSSLAQRVKTNEERLPKGQDMAAFTSKTGVLFYYLCDFNRNTRQPRLQILFADENIYKNPCDFWQDIKTTGGIANEGGVNLPNGKKPEKLIYRIIKMTTLEGDIVLDFHLGSGTTAAVAHKMKRQYIGCEQIDSQIHMSKERLTNVIMGDLTGVSQGVNWQGGGSFVYCELAKANQQFVEGIEAAETREALTAIWQQIQATGYLNYKIKISTIDESATDFAALSLDDQKRFLMECLDKNMLYIPVSDMESDEYAISEEDKRLTKEFYKK